MNVYKYIQDCTLTLLCWFQGVIQLMLWSFVFLLPTVLYLVTLMSSATVFICGYMWLRVAVVCTGAYPVRAHFNEPP